MSEKVSENPWERVPLGFLLGRASVATSARVTDELRALDLGLLEYVCMTKLRNSPGLSNAELARETRVTRQAVNVALQRLQEAEMISRPETVSSGRALPARLTRKGSALIRRAEEAVRSVEDQLLGALSPAQRSEFKRVLGLCIESGEVGVAELEPLDGRRR
ncbi:MULTISPECIES: MarR family winged helix-turn-helix transcriptional regulator [Mycolicibacterium]|uniref:Transcriptional regulatory protein n=1 Tax=Mycolicibacterium senegalense TaxID=1796 RepID=A0A378W6S0_9MYCO|nr:MULTISPECIES: MarR family transcriptional regulator [Mycolicibacterium]MCV7336059.1 MarR family transcriptional regulator [Mycolicibacterium senegalense]MDR7287935.1 DNA-binding MarR family transcriptional regulator [Mycolicibacterium senegalense]QZA24937.1 MarR family transcriptional regulator [Mycolicibacterium senegalense]CDP86638.1 transcriptional regulatory protein [Mycolicibacterium farcinogenes]SUA28489.1 transcriptional regulatory protein [Mycolicibacterium senegalense]